METVLDSLKAMGKATYREVAARLAIDPVEALTMLREQRDQGLCDFADGGWFVTESKKHAPATAPKNQAPRLQGEKPVPVEPETIRELLAKNSAMTTAALAAAVNRNSRGMVSVLRGFERHGVIVMNGSGQGVTWSLPAAETTPAKTVLQVEPTTAETMIPTEQTTAKIVEEIPVFIGRPDDLLIPSVRFISSEIRRTKTRLAKLEKLRDAVRDIRKHGTLVQELMK
ncbi:DUF1627 domain-containing protein [Citrobacter portucalensis]|uniref:DUF1627 domain-containing protein n=1 Tax=Citrobacter portucalensis TaxID=1639133 RepID=UPI0018A47C64|nr:DUF1627 domain-containing protein [Citrobacter portucalensis]BBV41353.1 hypothetical protein STW0522CIT26_28250 [Citrobacter portucalensis]BBV46334.1 hypothetical protein STW0522CIT27_27740 [Citrobacter portucalensis]BBV51616.1 hypothetical protein STW0522CIT30_28760 [Citrobacter portucalensis]BBW12348.1 hypothetical protein STN0717CIT27_28240 [Citrobacter portucalensis]BBW17400.1 hypothetical protein STN0717CIT36_28240 [Citrobacter portucalensis]